MSWLGEDTDNLKQKAQKEYEKALQIDGDYREARAFRMRIFLRARAHIDSLFVKATEQAEYFNELLLLNSAEGKPTPKKPSPDSFLKLKTSDGTIWSYLPQELSQKIFDLGWLYQGMIIEGPKAIVEAQKICDLIGEQLSASSQLRSLDFLREQLAEEGLDVDSACSHLNSLESLRDQLVEGELHVEDKIEQSTKLE